MDIQQILKVLKNERECIARQSRPLGEMPRCRKGDNGVKLCEYCDLCLPDNEILEVYDFLIGAYELAETEGVNEYVIRCKESISEEEIARLKELMNESRLTTEVFSGEIEFKPMPLPEENEFGRRIFNGVCPYTNKKCDTWTCNTCEVEERERKFAEGDTE